MRKLAGVALLALCALGFWLVILNSGGEQGGLRTESRNGSASFGIYSSEMAESGNGTAAVLHLFLFSRHGGNVSVLCSPHPLQYNVLVLQHASAPGIGSGITGEIYGELSSCGISARNASTASALASRNSVIIAPDGAVPSELAGNESALEAANDRVVAISVLPGREIDANGAISPLNASTDFEIVAMEPGWEQGAAREAAAGALLADRARPVEFAGWEGEKTVAVRLNWSSAYCRAVYKGGEGECRFADSGKLEAPSGTLAGPAIALAGQQVDFEFSPAQGSEVGRELEFDALVFFGRNRTQDEKIPGGRITGGWASVFSLNFSQPGPNLVRVQDQFGRLHAEAYVEVLGLEAIPVSQEGNRYEFNVTLGGGPVDGMVGVRLDGGERKEFYSSGGKLVVWASPQAGSRTMTFDYRGLESSYGFVAEGGGLAETYLRYGLPSLVLLAAVFLLLRAGRRIRYSIVFPEFAEPAPKIRPIAYREMLDAWKQADGKLGGHGLAAYPEEIAACLSDGAPVDAQSLKRVLGQLVSAGKFAEFEGSYVPEGEMGGFSAAQLCALRTLHDVMLERGMPFCRKGLISAGTDLEVALFCGKARVLERMGSRRRAVLFCSREELGEFERSLSPPGAENTRIKLAIDNGKLLLAAASRGELEKVL